MFENIAAIDIGSSSIKVVLARTGFRDFQVRSFLYETIDRDNEDPGEAIKEALQRFINENDLEDYTILTILPMENIILRELSFPFSNMDKIAEVLPFEAEENIPFPIEDVVLDFLPVQNEEEEGSVILTAAQKETIRTYLGFFEELNLKPILMGFESQALFECYRYFNKIEEELVIQLHIGEAKTIINIIQNNRLLYTRAITAGLNNIYGSIADTLKISINEAEDIFKKLDMDLYSYENNLQKENYKNHKIAKNTLKTIFKNITDVINELTEQISLTEKAFALHHDITEFNRILISGGGANITGLGTIISNEFELPVVSQPFMEDIREPGIQTQFPTAFGILLTYLNKREHSINLLKGEFLPDIAFSSRKKYYLAGSFIILTVIILIINIISTSFLKSSINNKYNEILNERLKKYFHTREISGDPIKEATKILSEKKKELDNIESLIHTDARILDVLKDIISFFPRDESFKLKNMVMNETITQINGTISSVQKIDDFKNKLIESNMFDNVTLNTNIRKDTVNFSMTIKFKISGENAGRD